MEEIGMFSDIYKSISQRVIFIIEYRGLYVMG